MPVGSARPLYAPAATSAPEQTPPRPARMLTPNQRVALDALVALGADLQSDFTAHELRSAFRALALRYHPDRHPTSREAERTRLARLFADAQTYHRLLLSALEPSAPTRH